MARSKISTAPAEPVRAFVEGVAKSIVDRLHGPDGLPWGAQFTEFEDVVLAVRQVLSEKMLDEALQRQAASAARPRGPEPRIVQARPGEVQWQEPATHCTRCRRDFFPSEPQPGD